MSMPIINSGPRWNMFFLRNFLFFLFCINISQNASASWNHLETEHFRIVIHSEFIETGKYIAEESERAYSQLQNIYSEFPKSKILMVVEHRTDLANGSASNFPYPHIVLYPTLPDTYSSIGEYKEWVFELVLHELVHFLSFTPVHGIYKPLNWLFGNYISPNFIMLPTWWHEGLAVHLETHLTHGGRMRSAHYNEMAKVLAGNLTTGREDLTRINERYIPSFPYGQRPYFYGSLVINEAVKDAEPKSVDEMVQRYSRTLLPYNIYSPTVRTLNKSFRQARKSVENNTFEEDPNYSLLGEQSRWLDSKTLITNFVDHNLFHQIIKYDLSKPEPQSEVLFSHRDLGRFEISDDQNFILFDAIAPFKRRYQTSDLFLYDFKTKSKKRVTHGLRVREGALSSNNSHALAVGLEITQSRLCLIDLKAENPTCEVLYKPQIGTRISFPQYIDDSQALFIEKKNNAKSQLLQIDLSTKNMSTIPTEEFHEIYWAKPYDGKIFVHGLKTHSDARQAYVLKDGKWQALSHDSIGIAGFDFKENQISLSRVTSKGYRTKTLNTDLASLSETSAAPEANPSAAPYSLNSNFLASADGLKGAKDIKIKDDSLWPYMLPHYWIPFIYPNYGGFADHYIFTLSTGSTDPLKRHSYSLNLAHDSISNRLSGSATYVNHTYQNPWGFYLSQSEAPLNDRLSRTYQKIGLFSDIELVELDSNLGGLSLRVSADYNNSKLQDVLADLETAGVTARLSYDDIAFFPADVAPASGQYVSLQHSHFFDTGDLFAYNYSELYFEKFVSKYIAPKHTSWKLFGKGIHSDQYLPTLLTPINYSGYFASSRHQRDFVIRGYPSGIFRAYESAFNLGLEFHFPILNVFKSPVEQLPFFFRRLYGNVFVDYGKIKGDYYTGDSSQPWITTDMDKDFAGFGIELHADLTILHYVPVKLSLGIFNPIHKIPGVAAGSQVFLNFATPAIPN